MLILTLSGGKPGQDHETDHTHFLYHSSSHRLAIYFKVSVLIKLVTMPSVFFISAFQRPVLEYTGASRKMPLEINFIYLGNKKIYCILRHVTKSLFCKNTIYFIILPFSV
jgi:hypothetical protein